VRRLNTVVGVSLVGVTVPYLARLPGSLVKGWGWLLQYVEPGLAWALFLGAFNLVAVCAAAAATALFYRRYLWVLPVLAGYGFLIYAHGTLDLASDAQAPVAVVFIPVYSVFFFAV
jgi:hypothetical protein